MNNNMNDYNNTQSNGYYGNTDTASYYNNGYGANYQANLPVAAPTRPSGGSRTARRILPFIAGGLWLAGCLTIVLFFLFGIAECAGKAIGIQTVFSDITGIGDLIDKFDKLFDNYKFARIEEYISRFILAIFYIIALIRIILHVVKAGRSAVTLFSKGSDANQRTAALSDINYAFGATFSIVSSFMLLSMLFMQRGRSDTYVLFFVLGGVIFVSAAFLHRLGQKKPDVTVMITETLRDVALICAWSFLYQIIQSSIGGIMANGQGLAELVDMLFDAGEEGLALYLLYNVFFAPILRIIPVFIFMGMIGCIAGNISYANPQQKRNHSVVGRMTTIAVFTALLAAADLLIPLLCGIRFKYIDDVFFDSVFAVWAPLILAAIAIIFIYNAPYSGTTKQSKYGSFGKKGKFKGYNGEASYEQVQYNRAIHAPTQYYAQPTQVNYGQQSGYQDPVSNGYAQPSAGQSGYQQYGQQQYGQVYNQQYAPQPVEVQYQAQDAQYAQDGAQSAQQSWNDPAADTESVNAEQTPEA